MSSAVISDCGRYRYMLQRSAIPGASNDSVVFCMLNPSTADADTDDPTIRRCRGFAERWDCAGLVVVNLYGLRATDPRALGRVEYGDAVGVLNDAWLLNVANRSKRVICAWGTNAHPQRVTEAVQIFKTAGAELYCLGVTKDGHPRHPLYLRGDARPEPWAPPAAT